MKTCIHAMMSFFVILATVISAGAQELPDDAQLAAWKAFNQARGKQWTVHWHPKTGTPEYLYGSVTQPFTAPPEVAARTFLASHAPMFKMPANLSTLEVAKIQQHRGKTHVRFRQTINKIPIEGAEYLVNMLSDGRIYMVNGTYYPDVQVPLNPKITQQQAEDMALQDLGQPRNAATVTTQRVVHPENSSFKLAWKVDLVGKRTWYDWTYFVDALDGTIIRKRDNIYYDEGTGKAYLKHPFLTPNTTTVTLENLDGSGYLRGTYADVKTSAEYWFPDPAQRAFSSSLNFQYDPSDWRFDEANAYYHINVFKQWMLDNYHSSSQGQVTGIVHELDPANAAFYSPGANSVVFGEGTGAGYNDHAREDVVIYHEYTHAMVWPIVQFETDESEYPESGAIAEGTADYFPGSFTGRSLKGEYVREGFAPREDFPGDQRDMADPLIDHYDRYIDINDPVWQQAQAIGKPFKEIHIGGEFFSSILWDIRGAVGQSVADELAWDALGQLTGTADFSDYRVAMVTLDYIEYNSAHISTIESKFDAKGVHAPLNAMISGPTQLAKQQQGTWDSNPTGGMGTRTYKWFKKEPPSSSTWVQVGTSKTYSTTMGTSDFSLKVEVHAGSETAIDTYTVLYDDGSGYAPLADDLQQTVVPTTFSISQNYPNPFNPRTSIKYQIPEKTHVALRIYNLTGGLVTTLVNRVASPGFYEVEWDGKDDTARSVASGIYVYRIEAGDFVKIKKMTLLR